jgi:hypothetical protein
MEKHANRITVLVCTLSTRQEGNGLSPISQVSALLFTSTQMPGSR